jgi:large subunit ribosomal protein L7/L12
MKVLKKIAVSVVMVASMLAISSTAFAAEAHKDLNVVVLEAAKKTEATLLEAKSLLEKGGDTHEQILNNLNEARQHVKEFRYEQTERLRQKLNEKLKHAREAFLKNDNEQTLADVNASLAIYAEMKKIYDAAH